MKKLFLFAFVSTFVFFSCSDDDEPVRYKLSLPTLDAETEYRGGTENIVNSWNDDWGYSYTQTLFTDESGVFSFDCIYNAWGLSDGFEFSNLTSGNYSAVPGKGVNGATYITARCDGYSENDVAIRFKEKGTNKSQSYTVKELYVTNDYYAYTGMKNGDDFTVKFEDDDYFILKIYDLEKQTEGIPVDLAKGTNILSTWQRVDLTALGETTGLKFEISSSDYGVSTTFCLDGIILEEK